MEGPSWREKVALRGEEGREGRVRGGELPRWVFVWKVEEKRIRTGRVRDEIGKEP